MLDGRNQSFLGVDVVSVVVGPSRLSLKSQCLFYFRSSPSPRWIELLRAERGGEKSLSALAGGGGLEGRGKLFDGGGGRGTERANKKMKRRGKRKSGCQQLLSSKQRLTLHLLNSALLLAPPSSLSSSSPAPSPPQRASRPRRESP